MSERTFSKLGQIHVYLFVLLFTFLFEDTYWMAILFLKRIDFKFIIAYFEYFFVVFGDLPISFLWIKTWWLGTCLLCLMEFDQIFCDRQAQQGFITYLLYWEEGSFSANAEIYFEAVYYLKLFTTVSVALEDARKALPLEVGCRNSFIDIVFCYL